MDRAARAGVAGPAPVSREEATRVLRAYPLGRLLFTRPGAGTANPALTVVTTKGEFFLKRRNPRYGSRGQLSYDHAVIRHLARAGLPVTPPIRTLAGSRWHDLEGATYEVYPLVVGAQHDPGNLAQLEAAGRLLGRVHQSTADLRPPGEKAVPRLHDPGDILRGLRWARDQLRAGQASGRGGGPALEGPLVCASDVGRNLPDAAYWALPLCIIHGDYHPANLKFRGDEASGLSDFDWVGRQPRMVDLADGLLYFCGLRPGALDPQDIVSLTQAPALEPARIARFGRGYAESIRPGPRELRALPDLLRARWLFSRVDAMERKIPPERKLDYLLQDLAAPLEGINSLAGWLAGGQWLGGGLGTGGGTS